MKGKAEICYVPIETKVERNPSESKLYSSSSSMKQTTVKSAIIKVQPFLFLDLHTMTEKKRRISSELDLGS